MKRAEVMVHDRPAGTLTENDSGYTFCYHADYLQTAGEPITSDPKISAAFFGLNNSLLKGIS